MLDSKYTEQLGCFISSTFSSFVVGLRVLYKARPIQLFQQLLTVPAITACLRCITFVHVSSWQHCQIRYQDIVLFQRKGDYQRYLVIVLLKHFEFLRCFHIQVGKCQDYRCLYWYPHYNNYQFLYLWLYQLWPLCSFTSRLSLTSSITSGTS